MKCLIIDDNPIARLTLQGYVSEIEGLQLAGACESAITAHNFLQKTPCDLLLLDVEMPGMSGLEFLKNLIQPALVILITAKPDYALEGYDFQVVDYLLKPVAFPRLLKAVQHAQERFDLQQKAAAVRENQADSLYIRVNGQLLRLGFDQILFVQALDDYVVFQTADKKYPARFTMKAVEERLPADQFLRVHRSYAVALNKIANLQQNSLQLGKHFVPVSERYKPALKKKLNVL